MKTKILLVSVMLFISILNSFGQAVKLPLHYETDVFNKKPASSNIIGTVTPRNHSEKSITGDNLLAYFPFNGDAKDESGNGHDGTVYGGILTEDRNNSSNSAYTFPNLHDQIVLANTANINLLGGFTLNAWVKYKNVNSGIIGKHYCMTSNGFLLGIENGQFTLWISNGGWQIIKTNETYQDNNWYMVTAVYDSVNKTGLLYIDGKLKSSGNAVYSNFNAANITISESSGSCPSGNMPGAIDEVKIYNRPLSAEEIRFEYNTSFMGLVAFYPFNGNANDESGNDNNGSVSNASLTQDRYGIDNKAYQFNGSADYISIPDNKSLQLTEAISLTAWVKRTRFGIDIILEKGGDWTGATCNYGMALHNINNNMFYFYFSGGWRGTDGVNDFNWHHYAVVASHGNPNPLLYIDGILKPIKYTSGSSNINLPASTSDLHIGSQVGAYSYYGANIIDEVQIYKSLLPAHEIRKMADMYLVAYYPFNGNANDESGNGNNGTITGALVTPAADRYGEEGKAYKFWFPDYVSVPTNSSFFTDEFTVSYWYKVEAYWGNRGVLSCVGNKGGYQQVFAAGTTFTYLLGYNFPSSSWFWTNYSVPNTPNTWQHITTTYKKTGINESISKLYINGELKSSDTYGNSIAYPGSEIFYIGRNHSELGLNGELDDVRMYNKALNDQEIIDLYLAETKPVLQNPENQSSVTTLTPEMLWSSPLANGEFRFQLSADSLFGTILHELVTTDLKTQLPDALLTAGQNYYWRVCALLNGETGSWSTAWSFDFVNTGLDKPDREVVSLRISPNPADISAKIVYSIPASNGVKSLVTLELVNSIGIVKAIKKLQNQAPGNYEITFDTSDLEAGIYFCRLKTKTNQAISKMVVIH